MCIACLAFQGSLMSLIPICARTAGCLPLHDVSWCCRCMHMCCRCMHTHACMHGSPSRQICHAQFLFSFSLLTGTPRSVPLLLSLGWICISKIAATSCQTQNVASVGTYLATPQSKPFGRSTRSGQPPTRRGSMQELLCRNHISSGYGRSTSPT